MEIEELQKQLSMVHNNFQLLTVENGVDNEETDRARIYIRYALSALGRATIQNKKSNNMKGD